MPCVAIIHAHADCHLAWALHDSLCAEGYLYITSNARGQGTAGDIESGNVQFADAAVVVWSGDALHAPDMQASAAIHLNRGALVQCHRLEFDPASIPTEFRSGLSIPINEPARIAAAIRALGVVPQRRRMPIVAWDGYSKEQQDDLASILAWGAVWHDKIIDGLDSAETAECAKISCSSGDYEHAIFHYDRLVAYAQRDPGWRRLRAECFAALGNFERARAEFETAWHLQYDDWAKGLAAWGVEGKPKTDLDLLDDMKQFKSRMIDLRARYLLVNKHRKIDVQGDLSRVSDWDATSASQHRRAREQAELELLQADDDLAKEKAMEISAERALPLTTEVA